MADDLNTFDYLNPKTKKEFEKFGNIAGAITAKHSKSKHYMLLLETIFSSIADELDDVDKVAESINAAFQEAAAKKLEVHRAQKAPSAKELYVKDTDGNDFQQSDSEEDAAPAAPVLDELLTEEDIARIAAEEKIKEEKEKAEAMTRKQIEEARLARVAAEQERNAALAAKARVVVDTVPAGMVLTGDDDDGFGGGFGAKGKGKGKGKK